MPDDITFTPRVTFTRRAPSPTIPPPGTWARVFQPITDIPKDIGEDFQKGRQTVRESLAQGQKDIASGRASSLLPNPMPGIGILAGGTQEALSPITGASKALFGDPIRRAFPNSKVGEVAANTAEDVGSMAGPAAFSKALSIIGDAMPGYQAAVKKLMDEGIKLTPGQIFQGMLKNAEDSLTSWPYLGHMIAHGQSVSLDQFNRAVVNRSLKQVGKNLPSNVQTGRKAIAYAENEISKMYDGLLPKLTFTPDPQFVADSAAIEANNLKRLPEDRQKQWHSVWNDIVDRLGPAGSMDGHAWKQIDSELAGDARKYFRSPDADHHALGQAISDLRGAFRDALERGNPTQAPELRKLNAAWAAFSRAQGASIRRQSPSGLFSPADLLRDIKSSTTKGVFARGDGLMQDLADAANAVLPSSVPDSGTGSRLFWGSLLAGGAYERPDLIPLAMKVATLGLPYTGPGMMAVNKAATTIPGIAAGATKALSTLGPAAATAEIAGQVEPSGPGSSQ